MWLYLITVVLFVVGLIAAFAGLGPVAILLIVLGAIGLGIKVLGGRGGNPDAVAQPTGGTMSSTGGRAGGETPQDDVTRDKAHVKTGHAHTGQAHMTPDQDETSEQERSAT